MWNLSYSLPQNITELLNEERSALLERNMKLTEMFHVNV
jgi:hypothetical protein